MYFHGTPAAACPEHVERTPSLSNFPLSFPRKRESIQIDTINLVKRYFVYILASYRNGTLYVGVTGDLRTRISLHQSDLIKGFTKKYAVHDLVYFEEYNNSTEAIIREKQLKKWNRKWKIELIEKLNPNWDDLSKNLY